MDLSAIILASGRKHNLDPNLINAVVQQESGGNPSAWNKAGGGQGAAGPMQVRAPALSDYNAANGTKYTMQDLTNPQVGVEVGSWYLGQQLDRFNDPRKAVAAYKDGAGSQQAQTGNSPYAQQVFGRLNMPQKQQPSSLPGIPVMQPASAQGSDPFSSLAVDGQNKPTAPAAGGNDPFSSLPVEPKQGAQQAAQPAPQSPAALGQQQGSLESFAAGLGKGFGSTVLGAQQLLGHGLQSLGSNSQGMTQGGSDLMGMIGRAGNWLVNDANTGLKNLNQQYSPYSQAHPIAAGAGNIGGSLVATAPLAAAAPVARGYFGAAGIGAGLGAATGALTPVENDHPANLTSLVTGQQPTDFWKEKLNQIGLGAATGGAMSPLAMLAGRVISPQVSDDVKTLIESGVTPTPGQILGGGFAKTEDKLTSIPVLGDMIKNAQQRAVGQFNAATYNNALAPIGKTFNGKIGQEGIEQVGNSISDVYDSVLPKMQFKVDPQFQADITNLGSLAQGLPDAQAKTFMSVLKNQIFSKMSPQGSMDGETLKGVQSELARKANGYLGDASFDNRELGAAISEIRNAVDDNLSRVNPPDLAQQLANANSAWARFTRLRTAAASQGAMNNEGVFTAAMLNRAVRSADQSVGKGATATGNALMQDLAGAGQRVLGAKYPDSGTIGRGLMTLLAPTGIAAGFATQPVATAATLGGIGLGSLPYTQLGQRATSALLTSRPQFAQPVANAVSKLGPKVVAGSLPALLSLGQ
ncbi:transglycosylase SLT domain-containing protein [Burkholderia territorii]|uniref:transglycosylase SLT domain-containing protein n=1 Tax=Burkholderia territorii TaxID=1503055 RepID=UPI0009BF162C|nr:transglycosylase SLT domain-containing protein [Burkholderia territorii]